MLLVTAQSIRKADSAMTQRNDTQQVDVLIAGAGFAGLALALALRQGLGSGFSVAVADPALARSVGDTRASAIAAAARRMFEVIGIWNEVAGEAEPILDMEVTDSRLDDAVRPVFLTFGGEVAPGEPFAHMIENEPLVATLVAKANAEGVRLLASAAANFTRERCGILVQLADGRMIAARLLVAADGARSHIRELAGIQSFGWWYGQSAIVTTVKHERDHQGRAEEHFLPSGPFAMLPLRNRRSSIVWTERTAEAERLIALDDAAFHDELEKRFGLRLGEINVAGPRRAYPLGFSVARSFIADRIALVGDAAHMIHPIAGQGLNMGLRDVAALAEVIVDAARLGLDPAGPGVLERYQRWRRFDTMAMGLATNSLNFLFSNKSTLLRTVRDIGLGLVDRAPPLKSLFIRQAAGLSGEVPRLLKGEAL